jgi:neutral ceramidase
MMEHATRVGRHLSAWILICLLAGGAGPVWALQAGLAARDLTPPVGVPLAGYGGGERRRAFPDFFNQDPYAYYLKPSTGILDPIRAKALVLEEGARKLAFISLDLVGVDRALRGDILDAIASHGFQADEVFVSATHTHSGPGALTPTLPWEVVATDRFVQEIYDDFIEGVAETVTEAISGMQSSVLVATDFETVGLQANRMGKPGHFDPTANLLLVKSAADGRWLGALVNLPVHGTALGSSNLSYSADVPGAIERTFGKALEELNGPLATTPTTVLFVNGAEGDVKPPKGGVHEMELLASDFTAQAIAALPTAREISPTWTVHVRQVHIKNSFLHFKGCASGLLQKLLWSRLGLYLGFWFPNTATIWSIKLGDMRLMTWPGEPTTSLGLTLREAAIAAGAAQAWILGLTNDHLAYFTTPTEFAEGGYEACASVYGPHAGRKIVKEHCELLLGSP